MDKRTASYKLFSAVFFLLLCFYSSFSYSSERSSVYFKLTILHNNDGESKLLSQGPNGQYGNIARFKRLVEQEKHRAMSNNHLNEGVIMVSSGDNYIAGPEFNVGLNNNQFYDAQALRSIGYDAICLGNHDFDFGPDYLAQFIQHTGNAPFLSSNLDFSQEPGLQALADSGHIAKSIIATTGGEKIGIIGATTPDLPSISSPRHTIINDVISSIQAEVDRLEGQGIDKIILISHLQGLEKGELQIAEALHGVDIMIAGGGDELLANADTPLIPGDESLIYGSYPMIIKNADGHALPVVTTMGQYRYLGRLVVRFRDGRVVGLDRKLSHPLMVADHSLPGGIAEDQTMKQTIMDPIQTALTAIAEQEIATSEVTLDGRRSFIRSQETNEGDLIADSALSIARDRAQSFGLPLPDVAIANGGGIRNDSELIPGKLTELDTFNMVPFGNLLAIIPNISRERFKAILENAVSGLDFKGHSGRFAQISGFTFEYDFTQLPRQTDDEGNVIQAGQRIQTVMLDNGNMIVQNGQVVPGDSLSLVTASFLARGGDGYPLGDLSSTTIGITDQQALSTYLQNQLGGMVTAFDYPEGGEGRITRLD